MQVKLSPQEARTEANRLVTNTLLGVMVTMDEKGIPQPRWMGAASMDNLRRIYCLTARNTRKLRQLKASPIVTWMFTSDRGDQVVTLYGMANIMESPMATQQVWDRIIEIGEPYFMSTMGENSSTELVAVETVVERIEFLSPRHGIYDPMTLPVA